MMRAFGRIFFETLNKYNKNESSFKMHSFHKESKSTDFYGTMTLNEGKISIINGSLIESLSLSKNPYIIIGKKNKSNIKWNT